MRTLFKAVLLSIFVFPAVSNAQEFLSQDEARHQAYCRWHSEAERIDTVRQLRQRTDSQAQGDVAYIMANCPPSQQAIDQFDLAAHQQQAAEATRYLAVNAIYQANGELQAGGAAQLFDDAQACDRFIVARMNAAAQTGASLLGDSVLEATDGTGFVWFGCIRQIDNRTAAYSRYIDAKMTEQRGRAMKRFPNL